ncbi:hypothetical protein, partial [Pseudomonas fulva]|uniref:hypothetical protein n=1 Tax=Pseudomonas fulva TaxID=47880 RepID=UPI001E5537EA
MSCLTGSLLSLTVQIHMARQLPATDSSSPALWVPTLSRFVHPFPLFHRSSILPNMSLRRRDVLKRAVAVFIVVPSSKFHDPYPS